MSDERLIIWLAFGLTFVLVLGLFTLALAVALKEVHEGTSYGLLQILHTIEILTSVWIGGMVGYFLASRIKGSSPAVAVTAVGKVS